MTRRKGGIKRIYKKNRARKKVWKFDETRPKKF
jgi:hypothetical protein